MTFNSNNYLQDYSDNIDDTQAFIGHDSNTESVNIRDRFKRLSEDKKKEETGFESTKRIAGQYTARAGEIAAGLPGNFKKAYQQAMEFLAPETMKELKQSEEEAFGQPDVETWQHSLTNPRTSDEIRREATPMIAEKLGLDRQYFEPKNKLEEAGGEFAQDLTSFFMPGTGQMRMMTRIAAPIVGNLTKQGLKYLGVEESTANKAKLGVMLASTIATQSNPGEFASQSIEQAKNMVPNNMTVNMTPTFNRYMPLVQRMLRGFKAPSKTRTMQGLDELAQQTNVQGRIPLRNLMDARDNINEWISEAGGFDIPPASKPVLMKNLNELKSGIIETIDRNLSQRMPNVAELYRSGYEAAAVTHQSNVISNFIERHFGKKVHSVATKLLFPGLAGGAAVVPKTVGAIGATYPFYKAGQVLYRVGNSPTLARYYSEVLRASAQGNVPVMSANLSKLDKGLEEIERREKLRKKNGKIRLEDFKSKFKNRG